MSRRAKTDEVENFFIRCCLIRLEKYFDYIKQISDVSEKKEKSDGKDLKIPKTIKLACYVSSVGVKHYFGADSLNSEYTYAF